MKRLTIATALLVLCIASYAGDITVDGIAYNFSKENPDEVYVAGRFPYLTEEEMEEASIVECYFWELRQMPDYGFYIGDVVVPSTITYKDKEYTVSGVAYSAFNYTFTDDYCLQSLTLPPTIKVIEQGAFSNNKKLERLTLGNAEIIKEGAFSGVSGLKELNLRTVKDLRCDISIPTLETLYFPDDISKVDYSVYYEKDMNLKEIIFYSTVPRDDSYLQTCTNLMELIRENVTLVVPDDALNVYKAHPHWGLYKNFATHSQRGISSDKASGTK